VTHGVKWRTAQLGEIALSLQPGFARQPGTNGAGLPHLRTNNVSQDGCIDLSVVKTVTAAQTEIENYSLKPGDILFNNTNRPALVGKTALFDKPGHYLFSNHMTRIRVREEITDPRFVARYLHCVWKAGGFRTMVTQWVNQAAINRSQLIRLSLPCRRFPSSDVS
jgi:type I restriction enzyme S subunit